MWFNHKDKCIFWVGNISLKTKVFDYGLKLQYKFYLIIYYKYITK